MFTESKMFLLLSFSLVQKRPFMLVIFDVYPTVKHSLGNFYYDLFPSLVTTSRLLTIKLLWCPEGEGPGVMVDLINRLFCWWRVFHGQLVVGAQHLIEPFHQTRCKIDASYTEKNSKIMQEHYTIVLLHYYSLAWCLVGSLLLPSVNTEHESDPSFSKKFVMLGSGLLLLMASAFTCNEELNQRSLLHNPHRLFPTILGYGSLKRRVLQE